MLQRDPVVVVHHERLELRFVAVSQAGQRQCSSVGFHESSYVRTEDSQAYDHLYNKN